jgi:hypothetical protein
VSGEEGRLVWRTRGGLRVGDTVARLERLHPDAVRRGRVWYLTGPPQPSRVRGAALLQALVAAGRVQSLRVVPAPRPPAPRPRPRRPSGGGTAPS